MAFFYVVVPPEVAATEELMTFSGGTSDIVNGFVWPTVYNTGPRAGHTLDEFDGDYLTSFDGEEVADLHIAGKLRVFHKDVWVHDCAIDGDGEHDEVTVFNAYGFDANLLVEYCILGNVETGGNGLGIGSGGYTIRYSELRHQVDGFRMGDGDCTIEFCLFHERWEETPFAHGDAVQIFTGNHIDLRNHLVKDCVMDAGGAETAAFFGADAWVGTVTVEHNWWSGGAITWRLHESGTYTMIDNEIEWDSWVSFAVNYTNLVAIGDWENNHWVVDAPGSDHFVDPDTDSSEIPPPIGF